jgi:hypothetical protein
MRIFMMFLPNDGPCVDRFRLLLGEDVRIVGVFFSGFGRHEDSSPHVRPLSDPILISPLGPPGEETRQERLERLFVERAAPVIEAVVARMGRFDRTVRRDETEDIVATVMLRLVRKLYSGESIEADAVRDFEGYVAKLTYRTIHDFMRDRYPERTRLKNRIRYLLEHEGRLAMWKSDGKMVCGLRAWSGRDDVLHPFTVSRGMASRVMCNSKRPHDAVVAVLERAGKPLLLDTLVGIMAGLWEITEVRFEEADETLSRATPSPAAAYEARQRLQTLWNEILLLPQKHRAALLLHLRDADGVNAVALFVLLRIACFSDVATAVGMSDDELAELWDSLPLDDLRIAERLQLTRQQVINLRRTARARLARGGMR